MATINKYGITEYHEGDIAKEIAKVSKPSNYPFTEQEVREVLKLFFAVTEKHLLEGNDIRIKGKFKIFHKYFPSRPFYNLQTQEMGMTKEKMRVGFETLTNWTKMPKFFTPEMYEKARLQRKDEVQKVKDKKEAYRLKKEARENA